MNINRKFNLEEFDQQTNNLSEYSQINSKILKKYISKYISIQKSKSFVGNLGSLVSLEEFFFFYQFLRNSGSSDFLLNDRIFNINKDLSSFFQFNSSIESLDKADLILLIGVNPKIENAILNLRIRKRFFNSEIPVGYVGPYTNLRYPTIHLGSSLNTLVKLAEGRHSFCKQLRNSKNPHIIVGSAFGFREDGSALENVLRFIGKKTFLNLKNKNNFNILQQNINLINQCELGFSLSNTSSLFFSKNLKNSETSDKKAFVFYQVENSQINKNSIFCNLNSYNLHAGNFSFPINTLFERNATLSNVEGRIQNVKKVISSNSNSRNGEDFFKLIVNATDKKKTKLFTQK